MILFHDQKTLPLKSLQLLVFFVPLRFNKNIRRVSFLRISRFFLPVLTTEAATRGAL